MNRFARNFILILFTLAFTAGCSVAVPNVTSLLSSLNSFKLDSTELRIDALSKLTIVNISARCDATNTSFEYELPDVAPGAWTAVPSNPNAIFTSTNDQCSTSGGLFLTLDLSSTSPFSSMAEGETKTIRFRDVNLMPALSQTQEFHITFSVYNITDDRFNNGQGLNNTKNGTSHTLQGRITNIQQLDPVISGSYTLEGKVVFQ